MPRRVRFTTHDAQLAARPSRCPPEALQRLFRGPAHPSPAQPSPGTLPSEGCPESSRRTQKILEDFPRILQDFPWISLIIRIRVRARVRVRIRVRVRVKE